MFKEADAVGLNRRLVAVIVLLAGLAATAAMAPAGSMFRDTQAGLVAGALALFLIVAASGVPIHRSGPHAALALFILVALAAVFTSVWRADSLLEVGLLSGYLIIMVTATNVVGGRRLRVAGHLLVAAAVVVTGSALYAFTLGYDRQIAELAMAGKEGLARQLAGMISRAFGNFPSANSFAGFLILFIPIAIGLLLSENDIRVRMWLAAAVLVMSTGLYFTFSKGALLAVTVGLAIMLFGWLSSEKRAGARVFLPLALGLMAIFYVSWSFFSFSPAAALANVSGRIELWRGAWAIAVKHPFLGIGPGAFETGFTGYQTGVTFSRYAHNTYLQVAAEQGFAGLLALLLVIGIIVARAWRLMIEDESVDKWLRLGFVGGLAAFSVQNFVDYTWYMPGVAVAFWLISGLAVGGGAGAPAAGAQPTIRRWALVGLVAILLVPTMLVFTSAMLVAQANHHKDDMELTEAKKEYISALRLFPFSAEAYDGLAQAVYFDALAKKRRSAPGAIEYQRRAIELRPTWPHYHARLADYLAFAGRRRQAVNEYTLAKKLYPADPQFKVKLGNYLLKLHRPAAAAKAFREAVLLAKVYGAEHWTQADLATARGDARDPIIAIAYAYVGLAESYRVLGRYPEARAAVTKAERILGRGRDMVKFKERIYRAGPR
ncbi:MAG: O-antigen ligase family protein [Actinomycetota bacterium]|nr:O-antigen ligase family protein [Actinomycetota bacterium]